MGIIKKAFKRFAYFFRDIDDDIWTYKLVTLLGAVLRVGFLPYILPDPFQQVANIFIIQLNFPTWLYEIVIRLILLVVDYLALSRIFYLISYVSVGNLYESGSDAPGWGSICYTIYYFTYFAAICRLIQNFYWWMIVIVFVGYAILSAILYFISGKLETLPNIWGLRLIFHVILFIGILVMVVIVYNIL